MKRILPFIILSVVQASGMDSDVVIGANYSDINYNTMEKSDTLTTTFQADFYRGIMSAQILTSYFRSDDTNMDDRGWGDTQVGLYFEPIHLLLLPFNQALVSFCQRITRGIITRL